MAKILIVERLDDQVYVYVESLKQHVRLQENPTNERRSINRVSPKVFDEECEVLKALSPGQWTSIIISE